MAWWIPQNNINLVYGILEMDKSVMSQMDASINVFRTTIPDTPQEWFLWLKEEDDKTIKVYRDKPSLLIADYIRERETVRDYEGREILELLQNANDQAAEVDLPGRVCIELFPEGLIVANTGLPFSTSGVASLQTSNLSPKRVRQRQIIGSKGLGFRAILNWSHSPIIFSGGLRLAYSIDHLRSRMNSLITTYAELGSYIRTEQQGSDNVIMPLLPFPLYTENGDLSAYVSDRHSKLMLERCTALIDEGYDTVIGMPFDMPHLYDAAQEQLKELRPEILLFTQNLAELCFRSDNIGEQVWKMHHSEVGFSVLSNDNLLGTWRLFKTSGDLPADAREADQSDENYFEITLAVPTRGPHASSPLFSYFPTDVLLPLPVVCHATLNLEQNRKHVQQGRKGNEYVFNRLASFLADVSEQVAATSDNAWAGCELLMPLENYPGELIRVNFPSLITEAAQSRAIVPTLDGKHVRPVNGLLVNGADTTWLPAAFFGDVTPSRNPHDLAFLRSLGVPSLDPSVLKQRILAHPEFTLDERVSLIRGLLHNGISEDVFTSALLLDQAGHALADKVRIFIAPSSKIELKFPDWLDIRFLNEEMRDKLMVSLGLRDNRELQQLLSAFGLQEYSLASLITALVAAANREIKANPESTRRYENDLLTIIFQLYSAEQTDSKRAEFPEKSSLRLPNQRQASVTASNLYMGHGYGTQGEILQALYENWSPDSLVAPPEELGLTKDIEKLKGFLMWVGIAEWPRKVLLEHPPRDFTDYLLRRIAYPVNFDEYIFKSPREVASPSARHATSIDGLSEILQCADPIAVTAWLALDPRMPEWQQWSTTHTILCSWRGYARVAREYKGSLPSHIRWLIESTPWLLLFDGERGKPKDCILGERTIESLFPHPAMPTVAELSRYGIRQADVIEGWRRAGVLTSLASLERDEIYAMLLELPKRNPEGDLARPLYHWLLDASDMAIGENGVNYKEFIDKGMMWGRFGEVEGYFPVAQLHHADTDGIPLVLLSKLKIVDLRKRVGADKVQRLFGVESVDNAGIIKEVTSYNAAVGSTQANAEFQIAKPYLFKLRASQTSQVISLQNLKDLQLIVCSELEVKITFKDVVFESSVQVWQWIIQDKTLYILADPADPTNISADMLCDSIGEALASVFRISDGGEFARMLLCQEKDRLHLLRKMCGETAAENIQELIVQFNAFQPETLGRAKYPVTNPPPAVVPTESTVVKPAEPEKVPVNEPEPGEVNTPTNVTIPLQIEPVEILVPNVSARPPFRISPIPTRRSEVVVTRHITDGDFCERKVMEFEQSFVPPRFPVRVSHITGREGAKCDILSFATAESRDTFLANQPGDLDTVDRFIEVKGRNDSAASIELRGNELSAAEEFGDRYFIYRLSESADGTYLLTILQNPLCHKEALRPAVHVILENTPSTQLFSLSGGLSKDDTT